MTHFKIGIIALLSWLFVVQPVMAGSLVDDKAATPVRLPDKPTYVASTAAKTASFASSTAPFFAICGSSTNTIRVRQIMMDYTIATTAVHLDPVLQKTSTAPSGGTSTALTKVPLDSKYPASTSNLAVIYTVAPTTGTVIGVISAQMKWAQVTATVTGGSASPYPFLYRPYSESDAVVLRGTAECVQAAWGTSPGANAPTLTISVMWSEE